MTSCIACKWKVNCKFSRKFAIRIKWELNDLTFMKIAKFMGMLELDFVSFSSAELKEKAIDLARR